MSVPSVHSALGADQNLEKPYFVEKYRSMVGYAFAATALAAYATFASHSETAKIIGMTVLTGVTYATANDMIACRDCIEYFTVGHFYDGLNLENRPIRSLNPTANALVWGPVASWHVSAIAGTVLAVAARLPLFSIKISSSAIAPYLIAAAVISFALAHFSAKKAGARAQGFLDRKQISPEGNEKRILGGALPEEGIPANCFKGWHMCITRNTTGYGAVALGGGALAVGILVSRIALTVLSA